MSVCKNKKKKRVIQAQVRQLKAVLRRRLWLNKKRKNLLGKSKKQLEYLDAKKRGYPVKAPHIFSVNKKPDEVFKFLSKIKSLKKKLNVKLVFINLTDCEYISSGAIALMISAIKELKDLGKKVSGSYPIDKTSRATLEKSGFFNYVTGSVSEENKITINTILQQGIDVVSAEEVAPLVLQAMRFLWGKPYRNPRVQSLLIELMANTVNHAFEENRNSKWYLSISHDQKERKVSFTFIDNGRGINKTLNLKFREKIASLFLSGSSEGIIKAAFDGKFGSRTKERKRGRGLPNVKRCFTENYISNLVVVTNDVYLNFDSNKVVNLRNEFEGTCYYWELDLNCVEWKIL